MERKRVHVDGICAPEGCPAEGESDRAFTPGTFADGDKPRALETIIGLTADADERVRYDAAMALGELGDTQAVPVLSRLADQDDSESPPDGYRA